MTQDCPKKKSGKNSTMRFEHKIRLSLSGWGPGPVSG